MPWAHDDSCQVANIGIIAPRDGRLTRSVSYAR
jgi:hypothetical protein